MSDSTSPPRTTSSTTEPTKQSQELNDAKSSSATEKENKALVTEVYEFAGEKVT